MPLAAVKGFSVNATADWASGAGCVIVYAIIAGGVPARLPADIGHTLQNAIRRYGQRPTAFSMMFCRMLDCGIHQRCRRIAASALGRLTGYFQCR